MITGLGSSFAPLGVMDGSTAAGTFGLVRYPSSCCQVCGGRSSGVHYGILSCEGCKAFYKRCVDNKTVYRCFFGETCDIGPNNRSHCKACRMLRCVKAGMQLNTTKMGRTPRRTPAIPRPKLFNSIGTTTSAGSSALTSRSAAADSRTDNTRREGSHNSTFRNAARDPESGPSPLEDGGLWPLSSKGLQTLPSHSPALDIQQTCVPNMYNTRLEECRMLMSSMAQAEKAQRRSSVLDIIFQSHVDPYCTLSLVPDGKFHQIQPGCSDDMLLSAPQQVPWNMSIEGTLKAIHDAIETCYGESFAEWDAFMHDVLVNGNTPYQPQIAIKSMIDNILNSIKGTVKLHCQFTFLVPGFSELDHDDQQILLKERWAEHWLMTHFRYIRYNNMYYLSGPLRIHYSIYWMQQVLEPDYIRLIFAFGETLNGLELTNLEAFLMLIVTIFRPDTTMARNKGALAFLHAHYADCLLYAIRSHNSTSLLGPEREHQIMEFLLQLRAFHKIGRYYTQQLDVSKTPFQSSVTVDDALSLDDKPTSVAHSKESLSTVFDS
ncbi:hypothetical protein RvY_07534 [Ramazzottius varieornatus]|uniref:Nuclear receptor domain-containing protein n=1 Tax=Ramazzottius varieornatus TaxID=947166 RepID=A0A1D1V531_RAMVA|nr:hypothetical protein RvY_07534 [Ramazzottius varieornatus]